MVNFTIKCSTCGRAYPRETKLWKCECGHPFDVIIEISEVELSKETLRKRPPIMWKYRELLPIVDDDNIITLNESITPIVRVNFLGVETFLKLDYLFPTGSFKDRGASVALSRIKELGINEIVEDSSGNAGAAIAAYSSVAKVKCKVFVPWDAPEGKVLQIKSYGAEVVRVKGSRAEVNKETLKEAKKSYYIGHLWNPFFIEGIKTLAYEAVEQTSWKEFDAVIVPVGSGGLLLGVYKGFLEFSELGFIRLLPRIYGVQSAVCAPVYEILHGERLSECVGEPLADGIAVPNPPRGGQVADVIKNTKGDLVVVSDAEIVESLKELTKMGFFVEPTSATVLAALKKLIERGSVDRGERVLMPLTGFGLKALDKLVKLKIF